MSNKVAIKQISFLWLGSILGALAAFFLQVILARSLGPYDFGLFSSALALVVLLTPLAGFGVSQFWLKIFGKEGSKALRWLASSYQLVFFSSLLVLVIIGLWAYLGPNEPITQTLLVLLSSYVLGQVLLEFVSAKFQLEERFLSLAIWQLAPNIVRLSLVLLIGFGFSSLDLQSAALIFAGTALLFVLVGVWLLRSMNASKLALKGHAVAAELTEKTQETIEAIEPPSTAERLNPWRVVNNAWPFALAAFFHLIYYQSDIIILKYMVGNEAAGVYNVAFTVLMAVYLLPGVIYQKFLLPKIQRWAYHDQEKFRNTYLFGRKAMLILGVLAMLGLWAVAFWAIPLLFGEAYASSVAVLNVLAISVPMIFLAFNAGAVLVTQDNIRRKVKYMGMVAILNLALNFLLIPFYGMYGAAIATVISNFVLVGLYTLGVQKYVFRTHAIEDEKI